jgi:stearoyl-CoA desaturase (delta-9 desaturase)
VNVKKLYFFCFINIIWRLFAHHGGGHRYFAHKSYKCKPFLAILYAMTLCLGDMMAFYYWVYFHNDHHTNCEEEEDFHSPHRLGFFNVHFQLHSELTDKGKKKWIDVYKKIDHKSPPDKTLKNKYDADLSWLTLRTNVMLFVLEPMLWTILSIALGFHCGDLLLWQCLIPRVVARHGASATNSFAHTFGSRPYVGNGRAPSPDCLATNCWYIAYLFGGEGWHNNHHAFSLSARHGLLWWEFDWVWLLLRLLAFLGIIWDLIEVSEEVRTAERYPIKAHVFKNKYSVYYKKENVY